MYTEREREREAARRPAADISNSVNTINDDETNDNSTTTTTTTNYYYYYYLYYDYCSEHPGAQACCGAPCAPPWRGSVICCMYISCVYIYVYMYIHIHIYIYTFSI